MTTSPSPEDEKAALEWLDNAIHRDAKWESVGDEMHRATLKALLAMPRLPAEPDEELISKIGRAYHDGRVGDFRREIYDQIRAHLTAPPEPKTREVPVEQWVAVNGYGQVVGTFASETAAKRFAEGIPVQAIRLSGKAQVQG